ncbi:MAG: signal peptidase I [Candidatus Zambryskibacteria bacterium RIFCSPLOWO2_01_FULL_47_14]|uniref:Signal peptidase I n=2 Tax=Candidatus Zambryskiibacteriota TaxID=1817925 RepID=A0A1G2U6W9_9BACT|nr:MAG: signal peptidase I [Candidatus Zambryskibacteria bacterium RIFCSPLOWO2_01_FULL_47_14]
MYGNNIITSKTSNGMKLKILSVFLVAFAGALVVRTFVLEGFIVIGDSMEPAIRSGDYVFINKLAFTRREPQREEVIVASSRDGQRIIKRVIGLPGERITIENGRIIVRSARTDPGKELEEIYLNQGQTSSTTGISLIKLDPGEYFALGDNRNVSIDSRELGPIDKWDIKGKVIGSLNIIHFTYKGF